MSRRARAEYSSSSSSNRGRQSSRSTLGLSVSRKAPISILESNKSSGNLQRQHQTTSKSSTSFRASPIQARSTTPAIPAATPGALDKLIESSALSAVSHRELDERTRGSRGSKKSVGAGESNSSPPPVEDSSNDQLDSFLERGRHSITDFGFDEISRGDRSRGAKSMSNANCERLSSANHGTGDRYRSATPMGISSKIRSDKRSGSDDGEGKRSSLNQRIKAKPQSQLRHQSQPEQNLNESSNKLHSYFDYQPEKRVGRRETRSVYTSVTKAQKERMKVYEKSDNGTSCLETELMSFLAALPKERKSSRKTIKEDNRSISKEETKSMSIENDTKQCKTTQSSSSSSSKPRLTRHNQSCRENIKPSKIGNRSNSFDGISDATTSMSATVIKEKSKLRNIEKSTGSNEENSLTLRSSAKEPFLAEDDVLAGKSITHATKRGRSSRTTCTDDADDRRRAYSRRPEPRDRRAEPQVDLSSAKTSPNTHSSRSSSLPPVPISPRTRYVSLLKGKTPDNSLLANGDILQERDTEEEPVVSTATPHVRRPRSPRRSSLGKSHGEVSSRSKSPRHHCSKSPMERRSRSPQRRSNANRVASENKEIDDAVNVADSPRRSLNLGVQHSKSKSEKRFSSPIRRSSISKLDSDKSANEQSASSALIRQGKSDDRDERPRGRRGSVRRLSAGECLSPTEVSQQKQQRMNRSPSSVRRSSTGRDERSNRRNIEQKSRSSRRLSVEQEKLQSPRRLMGERSKKDHEEQRVNDQLLRRTSPSQLDHFDQASPQNLPQKVALENKSLSIRQGRDKSGSTRHLEKGNVLSRSNTLVSERHQSNRVISVTNDGRSTPLQSSGHRTKSTTLSKEFASRRKSTETQQTSSSESSSESRAVGTALNLYQINNTLRSAENDTDYFSSKIEGKASESTSILLAHGKSSRPSERSKKLKNEVSRSSVDIEGKNEAVIQLTSPIDHQRSEEEVCIKPQKEAQQKVTTKERINVADKVQLVDKKLSVLSASLSSSDPMPCDVAACLDDHKSNKTPHDAALVSNIKDVDFLQPSRISIPDAHVENAKLQQYPSAGALSIAKTATADDEPQYEEEDIFTWYSWSLTSQHSINIQKERKLLWDSVLDTPLYRAKERLRATKMDS